MEKKSKKSIIIGITSLFLVTIILLGLTYAYYRTRIIGNDAEKSVSVQSKKMEVTYADGTAEFSTGSEDTLIEPGFMYAKQFSVENTGDISESYSILLDNIENSFTREDWKYYLYSGTYTIAEYEAGIDSSNLVTNGIVPNSAGGRYIVNSITIEPGEANKDIYTLVIVYEELEDVDQSDDMGSSLSLRVNIGDSVVEQQNSWDNPVSGTLLYSLKNNSASVMKSAEDIEGTSYYFSGSTTNNYVTFSNMCWQIVRVQGDNSTKLVLYDKDYPCNNENVGFQFDGNEENAEAALRAGDAVYIATTSYPLNGNGTISDDTLTLLNNWLESSEIDVTNLVNTKWCSDTSIKSSNLYDSEDPDSIYYLFGSTSNTLKCDMTGIELNGEITKATIFTNKIGLLTIAEVNFSNAAISTPWYASVTEFWSLTPYVLNNQYGLGANLFNHEGTYNVGSDSSGKAIRPVITLSPNVRVEDGGLGTLASPYVIS